MALLMRTKVEKNGNWTLTPNDARDLADALIYAANESEEHESIFPVMIGSLQEGFHHFYMNVNPHIKDVEPPPPIVDMNDSSTEHTPSTIQIGPSKSWWKKMFF
jgi:hypothetical protein